ncbi:hypothetical protein [Sphingobacterium paucimobilis]|uniref:Uncharacterized protein n=1 Tax=Sphingobacterium paucimobilis HER1398 TaxID=1346330 RepID=U2J8F3_9SPHI|nr:hypothetical protein [Sphingobacterium paucimobilis]ERJ61209.1 hypothetical protein M472_20870 [Sphingobacterium paucimobilis HER1398]
MDINKALLEKYELGQCTDQELAAVRDWLDNEDWGELDLKSEVDVTIKEDMWADISGSMDISDSPPLKQLRHKIFSIKRYWSAAAVVCILILTGVFYYSYKADEEFTVFQAANVESNVISFSKDYFDVALSANSEANIDFESGNISLIGNIMLAPKRDFVLQDERSNESFNFKRGEVYFVSEREGQKKLIILSKREIMFLPPVIQRRIKQQFHIS